MDDEPKDDEAHQHDDDSYELFGSIDWGNVTFTKRQGVLLSSRESKRDYQLDALQKVNRHGT